MKQILHLISKILFYCFLILAFFIAGLKSLWLLSKLFLIALDMTTTLQAKSKTCFGDFYHFFNMTCMNTELVRENEVNKVGLKTVLGANHGNGEYWICRLASQ